jgi:FKBP-type peptidyl-prolyl cis-trans isomerase 2
VVRVAEADYRRPVRNLLVPGQRVRHPERPEWGEGQVQSVVGDRVTVNFEHAGKVLVNTAVVALEPIDATLPW